MNKSKLNRAWHQKHRMPPKATMQERLHWHLEHAKHCGCRPIPRKVLEEMNKRGTLPPNESLNMDVPKTHAEVF